MSRFKVLRANPRRTLAALATLLIAVGVTAASGADFTATSANPSNTFSAGTLTMSNSKDNAAILTASNMKPGDPATKGEVVIKNTGSLARHVHADQDSADRLGRHEPAGHQARPDRRPTAAPTGLHRRHRRRQHERLHRHPRRAWARHIAPGQRAPPAPAPQYEFSVALDSSADNLYQGKTGQRPLHLGRRLRTSDGSYDCLIV